MNRIKDIIANPAKYKKFWAAFVAFLLIVGNSVLDSVVKGYGDGEWDTTNTISVVVAFMSALAVYQARNKPPAAP